MRKCYESGDFRRYFNENMQALGLPVPSSLFDTYQTAVATATTLVGALKTLGKGATMAELLGATVGLEKLAVAASVGAAAYTGAVVGSIAVASGRSLGCGSRLSDFLLFAHQNRLYFDGLAVLVQHNPQVFDPSRSPRAAFGARARLAPASFEYV